MKLSIVTATSACRRGVGAGVGTSVEITGAACARLEIRMLGGLEVRRDGGVLALPASRKTRALLAYLVMTGRPHTREHLCDLFWDSPDDPRAALRWSLSKLRAVVGAERLVADGDRVGFVAAGAELDLVTVRALANGSLDEQRRAGELLVGELCEGLHLPDAFAFAQWLTVEREALRGLRRRVLAGLIERLPAEAALPWARQRLGFDPFDAAAHADVRHLLDVLGRTSETRAQHALGQRQLERELATREETADGGRDQVDAKLAS